MQFDKLILIFLLFIWTCSCKKSGEKESNILTPDNNYKNVNEINLPTDSPRGLAFDGSYLWYSDDSLNCLYRISDDGSVLQTIKMTNSKITGFEFYENNIWCLNNNIVLYDTTISPFAFNCIYKLSLTGEKIDSILINKNIINFSLQFLGLTARNSNLYGTTDQGYGSHLYKVNIQNKTMERLNNLYLNGLTIKDDTIYAIDKSFYNKARIVPLDSTYQIIEDKVIENNIKATDLVFVNNNLWICDRENKKLRKIN